jgi:hypothetical protein
VARAGFLQVLRLSCYFSLHQMFHTHLSSGTGTIGQLMTDLLSRLSLTPLDRTKSKKKTRENWTNIKDKLQKAVDIPFFTFKGQGSERSTYVRCTHTFPFLCNLTLFPSCIVKGRELFHRVRYCKYIHVLELCCN